MHLILHITTPQQWAEAQASESYRGDTLDTEGFIHCSTPDQVVRVANAFYGGRQDLLLLCIDADRLQALLLYEAGEPNEDFPHIYGPLNVDAVVKTVPWAPEEDGTFRLPEGLPR